MGKKEGGVSQRQRKKPSFMKTNTSKNPRKQFELTRLAERGFAIHQQLLVLNEEFKQIKDRLKLEAAAQPSEHIPLSDKTSEGSQWLILGHGCECRIVFPDVRVRSEFDPATSHFLQLRSLAGDQFGSLFKEVPLYRVADKKTFRAQIDNLFSPEIAASILELSTEESEPKAIWKARPTTSSNP
jgi:hypothetical protein